MEKHELVLDAGPTCNPCSSGSVVKLLLELRNSFAEQGGLAELAYRH
jgi:hypothetical protein